MANRRVEERALEAVAMFEATGRTVTRITIKGRDYILDLQNEAEAANSLENMEIKPANAKK